jgi:septal ring factor EnvC (AmiA/AmiB activator)
MDPGNLALLIPIVAIAAGAAIKMAKIKAQTQTQMTDPQQSARIAALEDDVGQLRRELSEAQERIDFTERMLTQQRSERLEPPKP